MVGWLVCWLVGWLVGLWCSTIFKLYRGDVAISFIGGGNRSTRRKPLTCRKSLTNSKLCKYTNYITDVVIFWNIRIHNWQSDDVFWYLLYIYYTYDVNQPIKVIINHVIPLFPAELVEFHMRNIFVAGILGRKMVNVKVLYI